MKFRFRASGLHLLISMAIAVLGAAVVLGLWYPGPYARLAGGQTLLAMLLAIDVLVGPALTLLVANPRKPVTELRRDITVVALLQLVALGYGVYTIALARPVHLVFELDRFRVVSASDIDPAQLNKAAEAYRQLPWRGPTVIAARRSKNSEEMLRSLDLALQGADLAQQPDRWVPYASVSGDVLKASAPISALLKKHPQETQKVQSVVQQQAIEFEKLYFLPLYSRTTEAVVLVTSPDAKIVGYLPITGD